MKKIYVRPVSQVHQVSPCEIVCTSAGVKMMQGEEANEDEGLVNEYNSTISIWGQGW